MSHPVAGQSYNCEECKEKLIDDMPHKCGEITATFRDSLVREYKITAGSLEECEEILDKLWLKKEHSIDTLCEEFGITRTVDGWNWLDY